MPGIESGFVVVGVDDSERSSAALRWALARGAATQRLVKIIHCWQSDPSLVRSVSRYREQRSRSIDLLTEQVAAACVAGRKEPQLCIISALGRPESVLVDQSRHASLLVLGCPDGTPGCQATSRLAAVCHRRVDCPVIIVDRSGRASRYGVLESAVSPIS